jgi:hypothetical protein
VGLGSISLRGSEVLVGCRVWGGRGLGPLVGVLGSWDVSVVRFWFGFLGRRRWSMDFYFETVQKIQIFSWFLGGWEINSSLSEEKS